jgi:hypothetical protein
MNACFKYSYCPTGNDPSDPKSYRPISLIYAPSKNLKRLLLHRLISHVAEHQIYLNEQFGSRDKHSTSHQLLRVTKHITSGMLLLDVEKAFDYV